MEVEGLKPRREPVESTGCGQPADVRELASRAVHKATCYTCVTGRGTCMGLAPGDVPIADAVLAVLDLPALAERLAAAELVCDLYGITGVRSDSPRDKAATQAWLDWSHRYGGGRPLPTGELIGELAAKRDAIRAETLANLRADHPDIAAIARSHSTQPTEEETTNG